LGTKLKSFVDRPSRHNFKRNVPRLI
jgi:hypothetical protein